MSEERLVKVAAVLSSVVVFWQALGAISLAGAPESLLMMLWGAVLLAFGSLLKAEERAPVRAQFSERRPVTEKPSPAGYAIKAA